MMRYLSFLLNTSHINCQFVTFNKSDILKEEKKKHAKGVHNGKMRVKLMF